MSWINSSRSFSVSRLIPSRRLVTRALFVLSSSSARDWRRCFNFSASPLVGSVLGFEGSLPVEFAVTFEIVEEPLLIMTERNRLEDPDLRLSTELRGFIGICSYPLDLSGQTLIRSLCRNLEKLQEIALSCSELLPNINRPHLQECE